jgi:alkaline phosphatase D
MNLRLKLIASVFVCLISAMDVSEAVELVRCDGVYPHHLQGVCQDTDGNLYWSFTTTLVKTDSEGQVLKKLEVANHHGDLCYVDGRLFVAVNYGQFNNPLGQAENEIVVYQADTLQEHARYKIPQVKYGAGGIAHHDGKFIVVGGLPDGVEKNYLYEYNASFVFQKRHVLNSGWTRLGIQAAAFADGVWWFGCYGNILLKVSSDFEMLGRYKFDCGYGIEQAMGGGLLTAGGQCVDQVGCSGWITRRLTRQMLPNQVQKPITRIGFGSCVKQQNPAPLFANVLDYGPELFLFMGDNIYGDSDDMAVLKAKYQVLGRKPMFQKLVAESVVLATWDDHDYGMNDGGSGFAQREASQQVFVDFWNDVPDSPRRARPGVYDSYVFGPAGKRVQIILLDTRFFRSDLKTGPRRVGGPYYPDKNPSLTMLGTTQWQWLEKQLQQPAEIRIVVSSIQFVPTASGQETWDNLPLERQRFLDLLEKSQASGLFVVSGDRHWSDFSRMTEGLPYPLYDFTSSSINQLHPRGTPTNNPHRLLDRTFHQENFGTIDIDWSQEDPEIRVQIVDLHDKVQLSHSFRLSSLQVAPK